MSNCMWGSHPNLSPGVFLGQRFSKKNLMKRWIIGDISRAGFDPDTCHFALHVLGQEDNSADEQRSPSGDSQNDPSSRCGVQFAGLAQNSRETDAHGETES